MDSEPLGDSLTEPDSSSVGVSDTETELDAANVAVGDGMREYVKL